MFSLPLSDLMMLYLLLALAPMAVWWFWAGRRQRRRWRAEARRRILCRGCGHLFDAAPESLPARCPHCGRENEACGGPLV